MKPYYLYNGNPDTGKMTSLYWDSPLDSAAHFDRWHVLLIISTISNAEWIVKLTDLDNVYTSTLIQEGNCCTTSLTHCGQVMSYGDMDLGQNWLR